MSDSADLVHFIQCLTDLTGNRSKGCELAARLARVGSQALQTSRETSVFLRRRAYDLDLIDEHGAPNMVAADELVRVADVVAQVPETISESRHPGLVFTVPHDACSLVPRGQRLALRRGGPHQDVGGYTSHR